MCDNAHSSHHSHLLCTVTYIRSVTRNRQSPVCYAGDALSTSKPAPWKARNGLLDTLPDEACARLRPHFQLQALPTGKVLFEAGAAQNHMYFPRSGVISLLYSLESGDTGEIAMVGNEGVVGTAVLVDSQSTPAQAVVQIAGEALCLTAPIVDREFKRSAEFQFVILRYTQVLLGQMAQTAVCNRYHTVEKQLCRWLLQCPPWQGIFEEIDARSYALVADAGMAGDLLSGSGFHRMPVTVGPAGS